MPVRPVPPGRSRRGAAAPTA
ncbi:hypothetical protein SM139_3440, partial [Stenotrophomonas maltophilia]